MYKFLTILFTLFLSVYSNTSFAAIDKEILESKKCSSVFARFEEQYKIPKNTLHAISLQETQKAHSKHNISLVWPWTVNSRGKGYYFDSKNDAIKFVQDQIKSGNKSVDVGCMQINLKYHSKAFTSIEEAFSPKANIEYGAKLLKDNKKSSGSWSKAIGNYHSYQEKRAANYSLKVNRFNKNMTSYKAKLENISNPVKKEKNNNNVLKLSDITKLKKNDNITKDENWFHKVR